MNPEQAAKQRAAAYHYKQGWSAGYERGKAYQKGEDAARYGRIKTVLREVLED
jgi:hypothetical protein